VQRLLVNARSRAILLAHAAADDGEGPRRDNTLCTLLLPKAQQARRASADCESLWRTRRATVINKWHDSLLFDELLAQHGFAVLHADNRGMGGRGRAFAQAAYHNFGPVQLEDQLTVVDAALAQYPQLDPKRLGWWGWSWGGTFTLYAMSHSTASAPELRWRR